MVFSERLYPMDIKISYIGRNPAASPATGYAKRHLAQQREIIDKVFK